MAKKPPDTKNPGLRTGQRQDPYTLHKKLVHHVDDLRDLWGVFFYGHLHPAF